MRDGDVPQDVANSTYGGGKKLLYAVDAEGNYRGIGSLGWAAESAATRAALQHIEDQCEVAWHAVRAGHRSALFYYMYWRRMDPALLAQAAGLFRWRVRRHFKPAVFTRLPVRLLQRYAEALEIPVAELRHLPERPLHGHSSTV